MCIDIGVLGEPGAWAFGQLEGYRRGDLACRHSC